jgi:hypothetical protein
MSSIDQARLVDLTDVQLKELVGGLHEYVKVLNDSRAADEEIAELKKQAKELSDERYDVNLKAAKRRLAAARKVASLRGITFDVVHVKEEAE